MNLLLISVDSLRLDFAPGVSAAVRTPRFSATRDFHLCQHCFSVSSATRPVHTSLFTGLYPFEHGIEGQHSPAPIFRLDARFSPLPALLFGFFGDSPGPHLSFYRAVPI